MQTKMNWHKVSKEESQEIGDKDYCKNFSQNNGKSRKIDQNEPIEVTTTVKKEEGKAVKHEYSKNQEVRKDQSAQKVGNFSNCSIKSLSEPQLDQPQPSSQTLISLNNQSSSSQPAQEIIGWQCEFCLTPFQTTLELKLHFDGQQCQQHHKWQDSILDPRLTEKQCQAFQHMRKKSLLLHHEHKPALIKRIINLGFTLKHLQELQHHLLNNAPLIIHIHAKHHMKYFAKDTHYRNQFETGKSSGALNKMMRKNWENRLFDGKLNDASNFERVKYGAINLMEDFSGFQACLGYGKSFFLMKENVRDRCTFTNMDSSVPIAIIGTLRFYAHVFLKFSNAEIKQALKSCEYPTVLYPTSAPSLKTSSNPEDSIFYKEIQIHGPIEFSKDIAKVCICKSQLYADPETLADVENFCWNNRLEYETFDDTQLTQ